MEPDISSPFEEILSELTDKNAPPANSKLLGLSNLAREEMELFKRSWTAIEPERRRQIVYRLVELAEDNYVLNFDRIFKYCLKDRDDEVRCRAIEGLWESEEASLVKTLVSLLEQDSSEKVQAAAATALGKFAIMAECNKLRPEHISRIQEPLLTVVGDKNRPVDIRRRALEAVAPINLPQTRAVIMEAYHEPDPTLKASAIYAMGKNCEPSWLPILLKELNSIDSEVCSEAAEACGELEEEAAVPSLISLVEDSDPDLQVAAIKAIGKIGGTQAREYLEQCLDNPDEVISQAAEQALIEMETKQDLTSLQPWDA